MRHTLIVSIVSIMPAYTLATIANPAYAATTIIAQPTDLVTDHTLLQLRQAGNSASSTSTDYTFKGSGLDRTYPHYKYDFLARSSNYFTVTGRFLFSHNNKYNAISILYSSLN